METQRLLGSLKSGLEFENNGNESIEEEEWTEGSSYSSYSDSDRYSTLIFEMKLI